MLEGDRRSGLPARWEETFSEVREQWRQMWCERVDDKVNAEGIARQDYPLLCLERGTVVVATRRYRAPDFNEILEWQRRLLGIDETDRYTSPFVGGWGKFIKSTLSGQPRFGGRRRLEVTEKREKGEMQKKKGGRGWIHRY
jgi:hypothetical protein